MKKLYVTRREAWRSWLAGHHDRDKEVWLVYYKAGSGKPRIPYEHAVEEALCYGWIDSTVKSIDAERFAQRFTPRKKTSSLSQPNRERIRKLIKRKKMTKAGLAAVAHVFDPTKDLVGEKLAIPAYILKALKNNVRAWEHFQLLPDSYKRVRIAYIENQKRHGKAQHRRALLNFVARTAQNKRIGIF